MKHITQILFSLMAVFLLAGCSIKGIEFTPSFNSVNELKDADLKVLDVQKNNLSVEKKQAVSMGRGSNKMISPYGESFQEYLEFALKEELQQASIYNKNSDIKIKTELLTNKLNTGIDVGTADLSANFKILISNNEVFSKVYKVHHEWESSFAGAIAIPATIQNYPIAMQKLIDKFLLDKNVINIIKK